jgi:regulator of RNase E activity RraA
MNAPFEPLPASLWDDLRSGSVATLSTALIRRGLRATMMRGVFPLRPGARLAGEAFTVRYLPAREDLHDPALLANPEYPQRKAIETIGPGQVLVIDARGDLGAGVLGEILITRMQQRGAAGLVSDGPVRDVAGIRALDWPVFAAGGHPAQHTDRHLAVSMNEPIACGGVLVMPGDVLAGDDDGVVVLPRAVAAEVARSAREQDEIEAFVLEKIQGGSAIVGVYPPNEQTRSEFNLRRANR